MGVAVNGVLIDSAQSMTPVFDDCIGHVDKAHSYHYHLPPTCLLRQLGYTVPANNSWVKANASTYPSFWPTRNTNGSRPVPAAPAVVGWALDGFPIFGSYNATGDLVLGADHPESPLDACNGMKLGDDGSYAYYLTPTSPYSPPCLVGTPVSVDVERSVVRKHCPVSGRNNTIVKSASKLSASLDKNGEALFGGSCSESYSGPLFLFRASPKLSGRRWTDYANSFGALWLCVLVVAIFRAAEIARLAVIPTWAPVVVLFLSAGSLSRIMFFFFDPFYVRESPLPAVAVGILYGFIYPALNSAMLTVLLHTQNIIRAVTDKSLKISELSAQLKTFLPKYLPVYFLYVLGEFITQATADALRASGDDRSFLMACQVFYITLASGVAWLAFRQAYAARAVAITLGAGSSVVIRRVVASSGAVGACGAVATLTAAVGMICESHMNDNTYFSWLVWKEITKLALVSALFFGLPTSRRGGNKRGSTSRSGAAPHSSLRSRKRTSAQGGVGALSPRVTSLDDRDAKYSFMESPVTSPSPPYSACTPTVGRSIKAGAPLVP